MQQRRGKARIPLQQDSPVSILRSLLQEIPLFLSGRQLIRRARQNLADGRFRGVNPFDRIDHNTVFIQQDNVAVARHDLDAQARMHPVANLVARVEIEK